MKKLGLFLLLCLVVSSLVYAGGTWNNRERTDSAPMHINYKSGDTPWAFKVTNSSDSETFKVQHDGTVSVLNSGTTNWEIENDGSTMKVPNLNPVALSWTSGSGFSVAATTVTGSIFTISVTSATDSNEADADIWEASTAGVTVNLFTPTAATDGRVYHFLKTDSGTTDLVFYAGGLPIGTSSGTTNNDMDAEADTMAWMADYNSAVSWWIVERYIH